MRFLGHHGRGIAAVAALFALGFLEAQAQVRPRPAGGAEEAPVIKIRELGGIGPRALVRTPEYTTGVSRGRVAARIWAEIQTTFDSTPDWMDELTFQYYVLVHNKKSKDEHSLFKASVTYVDVAKGRAHLSAMYLRPSTLERCGEVIGVAVEVVYQGAVVATESVGRQASGQPLPAEWWKIYQGPIRDGVLLNRGQTPFAFVNVDDYESIK